MCFCCYCPARVSLCYWCLYFVVYLCIFLFLWESSQLLSLWPSFFSPLSLFSFLNSSNLNLGHVFNSIASGYCLFFFSFLNYFPLYAWLWMISADCWVHQNNSLSLMLFLTIPLYSFLQIIIPCYLWPNISSVF